MGINYFKMRESFITFWILFHIVNIILIKILNRPYMIGNHFFECILSLF